MERSSSSFSAYHSRGFVQGDSLEVHPRRPETSMSKILLAGNDLSLLATRAAVLSRLGGYVKWASPDKAESALTEEQFDVLVLCHTLLPSDRNRLFSRARAMCPEIRVMQLLVTPYEDVKIEDTRHISTSICEPRHLLQEVAGLLDEKSNRHLQFPENIPRSSVSH